MKKTKLNKNQIDNIIKELRDSGTINGVPIEDLYSAAHDDEYDDNYNAFEDEDEDEEDDGMYTISDFMNIINNLIED